MNPLGNFILRGKHWQIFLVAVGLYFAGMVSVIFTPGLVEGGIAPGLVVAASTLGLFLWFWFVGSFVNSLVSPDLKLRSGFFYIALIYPPLYSIFFVASFRMPVALGLIVPLHLFGMICVFYLLYFVSKALALAENDRPVSFADYALTLFLIWFFPLGIWIVQPRINRLYANAQKTGLTR